jgi:putative transposase
MDEQTVRTTCKYTLQPTPQQEQALAFVVRRCRELYNAALQERREAWQKREVSITAASQSAQLPAIKAVRPEYRDLHSQVVQDVLTRLDRAFHAFFRRVERGETPGYPRLQGANRYHSFTYKQVGNGATLDNGFLVLSKIGRLAVRWSRPIEGTPKTVTISKEADGWYVCCSCADVPTEPLPLTGQQTGIDVGLTVVLSTADGDIVENPRHYRNTGSPKSSSRRPTNAYPAASRAATAARRPLTSALGSSSTCGGSAWTLTIRRRSPWCVPTTCSLSRRCTPPI